MNQSFVLCAWDGCFLIERELSVVGCVKANRVKPLKRFRKLEGRRSPGGSPVRMKEVESRR
jgi:hypothetical protein